MKAIVSSKSLAEQLNKIKFYDDEWVVNVSVDMDRQMDVILINTNKQQIEVDCRVVECTKIYHANQCDNRWDWLKDVVYRISDSPILIDINERVLNITIQF